MNILQQIAALLGGKLTKVHEKTVANKEAIESEVTRAKASETLLDTNIKNETKRAQDEEARIELKAVDLVTKEETRATKAESALSTKIDTDIKAEADRARGAEETIINNLNSETARAKAAEKANSDAITSLDEKKVDKVEGKQLSTEDYTTAEKTKVGNLEKYTTSDIYERAIAGSQDMYLEYKVKNPETGEIQTYDTILHKVNDTHNGLMTPAQKLVIDNLLSGDSALSILGTPSQTWQLNLGSGPKIKNSGGVFELRDAADSAYADLTVNALTIKGDVTQEGGSFITQAETVSAKDNTILLNSGETGAGVTKGVAGVEIDRGTLPKYKFVFDESDDRFKVGSEGDLWSVMLRDNESDLTDKGILTWDATTKRAKTAFNVDDLSTKYLPLAGNTKETPITGNIYLRERDFVNFLCLSSDNPFGYVSSLALYNSENVMGVPLTVKDIIHVNIDDTLYIVWNEGNDGANSGLDADLLDGQHGSYYAKAGDLNSYLPLSAGVDKSLTGGLHVTTGGSTEAYVQLKSGSTWWKLGTTENTDKGSLSIFSGETMIASLTTSSNPTYGGSARFIWGVDTNNISLGGETYLHINSSLSKINFGLSDYVLGILTSDEDIIHYRAGAQYKIWDSKNLDISTFALKTDLDNIDLSGYLPLSGGTMTGTLNLNGTSSILFTNGNKVITAIENTLSGSSIYDLSISAMQEGSKIVLTALGGLFHVGESGMDKIWTGGNDGAGSGLDADLLDGKQGSEYALKTDLSDIDLSGYLPLSAGSTHKLTGELWAPVSRAGGPSNFGVNVIAGSSTAGSSGIEANAEGVSVGFGAHINGNAYFWVGGNSTQEKSYFASINKDSRGMNFQYRPMYNGTNLATISDIPTSLPANGGNADTVDGLHAAALGTVENGKLASYDASGYMHAQIFKDHWNTADTSTVGEICFRISKDDGYHYFCSLSRLKSVLGSMPASDVYSWAKASSKPSYAWSEITGKPTIIDSTSLGALPSYSSTGIPTTSLLAYWNGAYGGSSSNLAYCNKGAFGDMCTQTASNYVNVAGAQTISGAKTFTSYTIFPSGSGISSDIRLKKYINKMLDAEDVLSKLSGYRYVMKDTDMHYAGLIAQEVQKVLPEAVREDENGFLTVDTYPIIAALIEANKAKSERIEELENRLNAMEEKMNMILNKLG